MRPPTLVLALSLLPGLWASPVPNPQAAEPISQDFSSVRGGGGGTSISTISHDLSSIRGGGTPAAGSRSRSPPPVATATATSAPVARGPFGQVPFGVVYDDPEGGSRIHPFGREDLCVYVVNDTFVEGAKVELGRCLNNTLPYPGKRNIFNLSLPFTAVPPSNYSSSTATASRSISGSSGSITTSIQGPITVPVPTSTSYWTWSSPSWVPAEPDTTTSRAAISVSSGIGSSASSRPAGAGSSSISRPAVSVSPSPSALPEYQEYAYEGLIRPLGQEDFCLSGSVYIPEDAPAPAPGPSVSGSMSLSPAGSAGATAVSSPAPAPSWGSGGGIAARQETSLAAVQSSAAAFSVSGARSAIASGSRSLIVGSSAATSRPSGSSYPVPPVPSGARDITLQRCNASDPAQWWRLGTDRRVPQIAIPETRVPLGWGWKLSQRNQTQCASFLRSSTDSARSPRRLFQMLPCVSNAASQLVMVVNNGTLPANNTSTGNSTTSSTGIATGGSVTASRSAAARSVSIIVGSSAIASASASSGGSAGAAAGA